LSKRVYLDANATTPVLPEVRDAMVRAMDSGARNPSSMHAGGRAAARLLSESRAAVAGLVGARPSEVVFTSGGTESARLAMLGALVAAPGKRHLVVSAIEHPAIRDLAQTWSRRSGDDAVKVTWVRPGADGVVPADRVVDALRDDTALVALMLANNETGVLQPVTAVSPACRERGIPLLVDAVQAVGKVPVEFASLGADLMTLSAHKIHGPTGVGALVVRTGARWKPPHPATHEGRRRAGTEPLLAIVGFAAAAAAAADTPGDAMAALRDRLERTLTGALDGVQVNGSGPRVPNTTSLRFHAVESDRLLAMLDRAGIDASNGSACSAGTPEPSKTLLAMGLSRREAMSTVRFSLSRLNTDDDIDRAVAAVLDAVETLRRTARLRGGR